MAFQFAPFNYNQVSVQGTATLIVAANASRKSVSITNAGTTDVYVGDSAVLTTTGDLLTGVKGTTKIYNTTGAIYGITSGAAQSVSYFEAQ